MRQRRPQRTAPTNTTPLSLDALKRLIIIALFTDDQLLDRFVLKGGNAIDLAYGVSTRASVDIDISICDAFSPVEFISVQTRIERNLQTTLQPHGYTVFDLTMDETPHIVSPEVQSFWGGYRLSFKVIATPQFLAHSTNLEMLRRLAVRVGTQGKFEVDISKYEYCIGKQPHDMDGFRIHIYPPVMIVCEKLRALCQQMPEYSPVIRRARPGGARARDFLDIHTLVEAYQLDLATADNVALLGHIFAAKKVPVNLLELLPGYREFHRPDFVAVQTTTKPGVILHDFDFYFDYVLTLCTHIKSAWAHTNAIP